MSLQKKTSAHPEPVYSNLRPVRREARKSSGSEFVWRVVPPEKRHQTPQPRPGKQVVGTEVGVGADTSHLNKRRRRARVGKVSRAVLQLKRQIELSRELDQMTELGKNAESPPVERGPSSSQNTANSIIT